MPLGARLRKIREDKNLRLEDLEAEARVGGPHLSRVERGLKLPSADALERIATTLEVEASEIDQLREERTQLALAERIQKAAHSERVEIDAMTAEACAVFAQLDEELRAELARVTEAMEDLDDEDKDRLVRGMQNLLDSLKHPRAPK